MGAKYSHGAWEQFADQASTILRRKTSLNFFMAVQDLPGTVLPGILGSPVLMLELWWGILDTP